MFQRLFGIQAFSSLKSTNIGNHLRRTVKNYNTGARYNRFNNSNTRETSLPQFLLNESNRKYVALLLGGSGLFYVTHLEEAPVSGRKRFIWIPRSLELRIGSYSYSQILNESSGIILPNSHPTSKRVENIFHKILDAAYKDPTVDNSLLDGIKWQIHVVNDPKAPPNAFVLPGGKVFVYSGILPICKNDDGLATILSHEFAHQLARHTSENLSKVPLYSLLGLLLYAVTGTDSINNLILDGTLRMPASRSMETEADHIGLMIMSRACFNPAEAVKLWHRMSEFEKSHKLGSNGVLEFLSTHPGSDRRIENMNSWLSKAQELYSESDCHFTGNYYRGFQNTMFGTNNPDGLL